MTSQNINITNGRGTLKLDTNSYSEGKYKVETNYSRNDYYENASTSSNMTLNPFYIFTDDCTSLQNWGTNSGNSSHVSLTADGGDSYATVNFNDWCIGYWKVPVYLDGTTKISWKMKKSDSKGNVDVGFYTLTKNHTGDQKFTALCTYTRVITKFQGIYENGVDYGVFQTGSNPYVDNTWIDCSAKIKDRTIHLKLNNSECTYHVSDFSNDTTVNGYGWLGSNNVYGSPILFKDIVLKSSIEYDSFVADYIINNSKQNSKIVNFSKIWKI